MGNVGLKWVKTVRVKSGGKLKAFLYFDTGERKPNGAKIYRRLPDPSDWNFASVYANLQAIRTKRERRESLITVPQAIQGYQLSTRFLAKKPATQKAYVTYLKRIERAYIDKQKGAWPVVVIERPHIRTLLDGLGGGAQNTCLAVLREVLKWCRTNDKLPPNFDPTAGIDIDHEATPHEPWPEWLIEAALADNEARLAVALLYYTGQRIGAVVRMKWTDIEDGTIHVPPHKRTGDLWIPLHSRLQTILAQQPKSLTTIICNPNGRPVSSGALRQRLQKWAKAKGLDIVPHGLRKNAVDALLEAGCTAAQVSSITGQSLQMVEYYSRKRNTRKIAQKAMAKWDVK